MIHITKNVELYDNLPTLSNHPHLQHTKKNIIFRTMFLLEEPFTQKNLTDKANETWDLGFHYNSLGQNMKNLISLGYLKVIKTKPYIYVFTSKFRRLKNDSDNTK